MQETIEYIDNYFTNNLSESDRALFEQKCETDPAFAREVATYVTIRAGLKTKLRDEKRREFDELHKTLSEKEPAQKSPVRTMYRFWAAAAAGLLLIAAGWFFFNDKFAKPTAALLAAEYIEKNIEVSGVKMGAGNQTSLDSAIALYNKKEYEKAEPLFERITGQENNYAEAVKYLGFISLMKSDYDQAILRFDTLAKQTGLYANPGLFYKAVTLMKRSGKNDVANARVILQEIIDKDLPGNKEAAKWISGM